MKIDEYGADAMPDHQREGEVLQRRAAEDEQRGDRQQRDERRRRANGGSSPTARRSRSSRTTRARISGMFSRMRSKMMIVS